MKITVPFQALDIMGLLNTAADFHIRLCGNKDQLFAYLGTEQERIDRYDRDITEFYSEDMPFDRDAHLLHLRDDALLAGKTIILPFASPRIDESFPCIDGKDYTIDCQRE